MTVDLSLKLPSRLFSVTWQRPSTPKAPLRTVLRRSVRKTVRTRGRNFLPTYGECGNTWTDRTTGETKWLVRTRRLSTARLLIRYTRRYPMTMAEVGQWADQHGTWDNLDRVRSLSHTA